MPFTIIPLAINTLSVFMLWNTETSITAKIIVIFIFVLKYSVYFHSVLMAESGIIRYYGLAFCAMVNIGLLIYTIINSLWTVTTGIVITLVLLIIWFLAVFSFENKEGNEQ